MRRLAFLLIFGLGGVSILIGLGVWQVQRLAWKQDLLARIDAEIAAPPVSLADGLAPQFRRYAPVELTGQFGDDHIRMLASRKSIGPVYRIIRPFAVDGHGAVLIDTGWQPQSANVVDAPDARLTLTGNLDAPKEADDFIPEPDINSNIWFARDVPAMAEALGTDPVLVVLRELPDTVSESELGVTPWPVDSAGISNDHLQYAITWFSLAAIWGMMTAFFVLRPNRNSARKD